MNWKYLVSWIPGIPIGIVNGILRISFYERFLTELHAHQLSVASFILFFGIYAFFILKWIKLFSMKGALKLGLIWLILTVGFEFLFGHFIMGHPWSSLFHDYNLFAGRLWVLVLAWIALAPSFLHRISRINRLSSETNGDR